MTTLDGVVEARNPNGVKILGNWCNVSRFRPLELPDVGARVHAELDAKGFLRQLDIIDPAPASPTSNGHTARDATITRLALIKAAAAFSATRTDIKSADVVKIAALWEKWVQGD